MSYQESGHSPSQGDDEGKKSKRKKDAPARRSEVQKDGDDLEKLFYLASANLKETLFLQKSPLDRVSYLLLNFIEHAGLMAVITNSQDLDEVGGLSEEEKKLSELNYAWESQADLLITVNETDTTISLTSAQVGQELLILFVGRTGNDSAINGEFYISNKSLSSRDKLLRRLLSIIVQVTNRLNKTIQDLHSPETNQEFFEAMSKTNDVTFSEKPVGDGSLDDMGIENEPLSKLDKKFDDDFWLNALS